ncbi:glycosyl hydrolase family protein [Dactylonectria macrodidyma]|uniref:Glycosyl hydrolase family protein n=1 Tax=Dactylonectria macrodidyma TaxID=307937 RepID=A0A9P9JC08_9HYPO|nr:glycosyl hydrolase family protein [Dactylonectria macrodidyma]
MTMSRTNPSTEKPNSDKFARWRPKYHLLAPNGWMNDPCGLNYDAQRRKYHAFFQWNPFGNDWGNMSWGHAVSDDMVSWSVFDHPALEPDKPYDGEGVFTGALFPAGLDGNANGTLTLIYTSVSKSPIHYTLPYSHGCETLSLATSCDGGLSWNKVEGNPILPGPPSDTQAISWRDPYVACWPGMSRVLGLPSHQVFGLLSGGIRHKTPTTWLYAVGSTDLTDWRCIGPLVDIGKNFCPSGADFDMGVNFECGNFMSLEDADGGSTDFLIMSCEGVQTRGETADDTTSTCIKTQGWMSGPLVADYNGSAQMQWECGGRLDFGSLYAANSFWDPVIRQQITMGWIPEDGLPDATRHQQGWSGCLSLPRVLRSLALVNVTGSRHGHLLGMGAFAVMPDRDGTFILRTLGVSPHPNLESLRKCAREIRISTADLAAPKGPRHWIGPVMSLKSQQWELKCKMALKGDCQRVGLNIFHSSNGMTNMSRVYFEAVDGRVIIQKAAVHTVAGANVASDSAPHPLFRMIDTRTGAEMEEELLIHMFYDQGVLEVFFNERTTVTSRLYPLSVQDTSLQLFAEGTNEAEATPLDVQGAVWDGLAA